MTKRKPTPPELSPAEFAASLRRTMLKHIATGNGKATVVAFELVSSTDPADAAVADREALREQLVAAMDKQDSAASRHDEPSSTKELADALMPIVGELLDRARAMSNAADLLSRDVEGLTAERDALREQLATRSATPASWTPGLADYMGQPGDVLRLDPPAGHRLALDSTERKA